MKNFLLLIIIINFLCCAVYAEDVIQTSPPQNPTAPQSISFENCTKMFTVNKEKLFYLTIGAITANKFTIDEIQSNNGYIIYTAARRKYLATVSGIDKDNSILKITPCSNIYYFPSGVISNIFKYIELNKNTQG